jgi:hypothetical protein
MKNTTFIVIIVSLFLINSLSAQLENRFSLGPRIGVNFANINQSNTKSLTGLVAGITSTHSINETSGITIDALFSGEGYKTNSTEVQLDYLRIPIFYNTFF